MKLGAKASFQAYSTWQRKVEGAFLTNNVIPDTVAPADLMRLGYMFFSETFYQHLEDEGTLGDHGLRWPGLLRHLETREFEFTFAKLEGELERLK